LTNFDNYFDSDHLTSMHYQESEMPVS